MKHLLALFLCALPLHAKILAGIKVPTLLLHGRDDKLAGFAGSQMVYDRISSTDKTLNIYDHLYHEIFNELPADRARVFQDMTAWLKAGKIKYQETILDGIANAPAAMIGLMEGRNSGKMLVRLA